MTNFKGLIFDIDTFAVHDGPGIRMAVYMKGCPLHCGWCHSPESRHTSPELIFMRDRCRRCGMCVIACVRKVHEVNDSKHVIVYEKCIACGKCVENCPHNALAIKGYYIHANVIIEKARRMKPFFDYSGGGITLTGGEVTAQTDFAESVLAECKAHFIHTAIETSGACNWNKLERLVKYTDLVLYDLKLINDEEHLRWTGISNKQILDNASRLSGYNVQIRVPLIPNITDREENLRGIFAFMQKAGLRSVALLPYNTSASAKYEWLGLEYEIHGESQNKEFLDRIAEIAHQYELESIINP
jgi:pyruvate formate lyase activating enzyme